MSKRRKQNYEVDDEFFAQLDFLRADYDEALQMIAQQKQDILKLLALLIEKDVSIPRDILDRYIKYATDSVSAEVEKLPFD